MRRHYNHVYFMSTLTMQFAVKGQAPKAATETQSKDVTGQVSLRGNDVGITIQLNKNGLPYATVGFIGADGNRQNTAINLTKTMNNRIMEHVFPADQLEEYIKLDTETNLPVNTGRMRAKKPTDAKFGISHGKYAVYYTERNGAAWFTLGKPGGDAPGADEFTSVF